MKKKSNIKQYYKDNALVIALLFLSPNIISIVSGGTLYNEFSDVIFSIVYLFFLLIPFHINTTGDYPKWNNKLEEDEKILYTETVNFKRLVKFKYDLLITNKNVILKNIYGVEKYNIIFPLEKILNLEIEKKKLVLKFKFYNEIKLKAENPELIIEEFDKVKSNLLANKEEILKELVWNIIVIKS